MNGNQLSGPIPNAWWTLSHLKILDLGHNEGINGIIPNFLGTKVKDLRVIDFRETNLEGSIPDILEHLTNLGTYSTVLFCFGVCLIWIWLFSVVL